MYSYKLFVLLVLVVLLQEGDAKYKRKYHKRRHSSSSDESSSKTSAKVCDAEMNCGENEDAMNCTTPPSGCPGMFQCKNSTCIDLAKVCDAEMNCGENEDEMNCTTPPPGCPGMFQCKNLTCIDKAKVCDTEMNCGENEDELNCPESCPRVCDYVEPKCFTHLIVPDAVNPFIFIDVNGFEITSDPVLVRCQSACNANTACVAAILELDYMAARTRTCFMSMLTSDQLGGNSNITTRQKPCDATDSTTVHFVYDVNECIME